MNHRDWKTFNELHTDDVLRISEWSGIREGDEYMEQNKRSFQRNMQGEKTIDFWFEHRIHSENVATKLGIIRLYTANMVRKSPFRMLDFM